MARREENNPAVAPEDGHVLHKHEDGTFTVTENDFPAGTLVQREDGLWRIRLTGPHKDWRIPHEEACTDDERKTAEGLFEAFNRRYLDRWPTYEEEVRDHVRMASTCLNHWSD